MDRRRASPCGRIHERDAVNLPGLGARGSERLVTSDTAGAGMFCRGCVRASPSDALEASGHRGELRLLRISSMERTRARMEPNQRPWSDRIMRAGRAGSLASRGPGGAGIRAARSVPDVETLPAAIGAAPAPEGEQDRLQDLAPAVGAHLAARGEHALPQGHEASPAPQGPAQADLLAGEQALVEAAEALELVAAAEQEAAAG